MAKNKVLIVVDMQKDFVTDTLGSEEAKKIVTNVVSKVKENDFVIYTRDTHQTDYLETREGRYLPVSHCIEGTEGWELIDELKACNPEHIIDKPSFGYTGWAEKLADFNPKGTIELIGVCTDICVVSNALILKALYPEADLVVDAGCCAGTTVENHKAALQTMRCCQIDVVNET